ncbi:hypothetical protein Y032_0363g3521 [Ancylostoma ceylanicum]|nr:hypothetical protein Y032_0363g3521 [Ancylostoma ceylanicum]
MLIAFYTCWLVNKYGVQPASYFQTIDGSRIMEKKSKKKKSPIVVEKMPDLNNIELNTPKPVYGPMAELAEEGKIIQEEKKTTT